MAPEDMAADEVANQSPPYADVDLFASDQPLQDIVAANGAADEAASLSAFGRHWGSAEKFEQARLANENPPQLTGERVVFHPAYHRFITESIHAGLHASTWRADATPALAPGKWCVPLRFYMVAQVENGHMCPVTMTRAAVAALAAEPALARVLLPKILSRDYDPSFKPWTEKSGITLDMGMTEKQGGTDVRANITRAARSGDAYRITGHKWFMSAPMCDAFLVLAQAPDGLTCFFMPRFRPDGELNGLNFQKLKDKLGNRSNASSEVEFADAYALRIGEEGRGIRTILQMVQLTRLDCAISSAGMMRAALARALHHCRHRSVFQKRLADQPMMRAVLADMALEVEAAAALVMRLCRSFDANEAVRARLLTPAIKYWVCKRAPAFIYEAMECLGGNGYVEDHVLARLYREAPVNAIWEGSGNVMCLDVLRAMARDPDGCRAVLAELVREAENRPGVKRTAADLMKIVASPSAESAARGAVERLALIAAVAALQTSVPGTVAEAFARTRLAGQSSVNLGANELSAAETDLLLSERYRYRDGA